MTLIHERLRDLRIQHRQSRIQMLKKTSRRIDTEVDPLDRTGFAEQTVNIQRRSEMETDVRNTGFTVSPGTRNPPRHLFAMRNGAGDTR